MKRVVTNYVNLGGIEAFNEFEPWSKGRYQNGAWSIAPQSIPRTLLTEAQLVLLEELVSYIVDANVPGDFIEAGVWRGGAVIYLRAIIEAWNIKERQVIAADTFDGIPKNEKDIGDPVDAWSDRWRAGLGELKGLVDRLSLTDRPIRYICGDFKESLEELSGTRLALIRLDADSFDSTYSAIAQLYPKLSQGGAVIIDDWHLPGCRAAITKFREEQGIEDPIVHHPANEYWIKSQTA